jgi:hypothetical protein
MFWQPWVRSWAHDGFAERMRRAHPLRLQYEMFTNANPFMRPILSSLDVLRPKHREALNQNPFWEMQEQASEWIEASLNAYRDMRDHASEAMFHTVYGSPLLQTLVGLKTADASHRRGPGKSASHLAFVSNRIDELLRGIKDGGPREAALRALLYIRMPDGVVDERSFNLLRRMRDEAGKGLSLADFKKVLREQFFMLLLDERGSVEAIPNMLKKDRELASRMKATFNRMIDAVPLQSDEAKARLIEMQGIFDKIALAQGPATPEPKKASHAILEQKKPHMGTVRPMRPHVARPAKH